MADDAVCRKILEFIPQQKPFRFVDEILEANNSKVVAAYRFRHEEWFYPGHFPGNPLTPGVILIETMAQAGLAVMAIYIQLEQGLEESEIRGKNLLFATADNVEFFSPVKPGDRVIVNATKIYFKRGTLKSHVEARNENGTLVCTGVLTGKEVSKNG